MTVDAHIGIAYIYFSSKHCMMMHNYDWYVPRWIQKHIITEAVLLFSWRDLSFAVCPPKITHSIWSSRVFKQIKQKWIIL